jgi:hypothetical protein
MLFIPELQATDGQITLALVAALVSVVSAMVAMAKTLTNARKPQSPVTVDDFMKERAKTLSAIEERDIARSETHAVRLELKEVKQRVVELEAAVEGLTRALARYYQDSTKASQNDNYDVRTAVMRAWVLGHYTMDELAIIAEDVKLELRTSMKLENAIAELIGLAQRTGKFDTLSAQLKKRRPDVRSWED